MATFGEFLRSERDKKGLNQSDFGQEVGVIMTDLSKIENGRKKFPYSNFQKLAVFLNKDIEKLKNLYVADILVEEAHKYNCSDSVFSVAESQSKYLRNKNVKQGELEL
ncbi:XRE family transcriptional regulator [Polaribacter sp. ALD11]|uniref:helix-turn-helix domain-containing protein n=1 Tax=Polaribacter sp. ALD11 TaxID=2058137 RepID=UPI000C30826F|nr:helix-turn-helix transcriptional regulator [Polaribacter sp. ALD11]AUC84802.1 XRE family transcriptional regulator [Polaribacter sp. ALD11]